jgi:hypothetical protein
MASGNDFRFALSKEVTYGTRVAPARFVGCLTGEDIAFERARAFSAALGMGRMQRPSTLTTRGGSGALSGEVPTTGLGFLLDGLHGNSVSPVQQAATPAYLQTHTLDTAPSKSYTIQKQIPPVLTSTLLPVEYVGAVFSGITFNWAAAGLFRFSIPTVVRDEDTTQTLVSYVAPTGWVPFGFQGGSVTIGGSLEGNIMGDGSMTYACNLRDDAFALGTGGTMAKPVETDKPTASGTFTADFNDLTNINRVANNTQADVVLKFEGAVISGAYKFYLEITIPDCVFTSPSPTVDGPGPVQQTVTFTAASSTNDPIVIKYMSTDVAL